MARPSASGGGKSSLPRKVAAGEDLPAGLDLENNPRDADTIRTAIKRWPRRWAAMDPAAKARIVNSLKRATETADQLLDAPDESTRLSAAGTVANLARTAVAMEAQEQADDHLADKNSRLDAGLATERVGIPIAPKYFGIPKPNDDDRT